jgi:hypothetical protein
MCKYCKDDIFGALERLYQYYLELPQEEVQNLVQIDVQHKKRGRPKK